MKSYETAKMKRFLIYGMIGAILTAIGDLASASKLSYYCICCYLVTGMKKDLETGTAAENILQTVLAEQGGYVIPSGIVFFIFYFLNVITMLLIVAKKRTILPGWMWIVNPLTFKILLNAIGKLGTSAFLNGLACSNMSLGGLIIMAAWLIVIMRKCE